MSLRTISSEAITVSNTIQGFTAANIGGGTGVMMAHCTVEDTPVRVNISGTNPAAGGPGHLYEPGDVFEIWGDPDLQAFEAIRETGTDSVLQVTYQGVPA